MIKTKEEEFHGCYNIPLEPYKVIIPLLEIGDEITYRWNDNFSATGVIYEKWEQNNEWQYLAKMNIATNGSDNILRVMPHNVLSVVRDGDEWIRQEVD